MQEPEAQLDQVLLQVAEHVERVACIGMEWQSNGEVHLHIGWPGQPLQRQPTATARTMGLYDC